MTFARQPIQTELAHCAITLLVQHTRVEFRFEFGGY